jgi:hypothetical protein
MKPEYLDAADPNAVHYVHNGQTGCGKDYFALLNAGIQLKAEGQNWTAVTCQVCQNWGAAFFGTR